ncbi:MAG: choice-of-anchor D domain-containing protein [Acidobacteriales bacterium]|nr:choice-of-anchor D domain-containing protein [Terriglobales bacterium]
MADFNQDGITDISVSYTVTKPQNQIGAVVTVFSTGTPFNPAANPWPMYLQNPRNTGVLLRDRSAPSVTITSPANGANVFGSVTITAAANDDFGVASVQFQIDNVNFGAPVTQPPYSAVWDLTNVPLGSHILTAIARDQTGNFTKSAPVTVNVVSPPSAAFSAAVLAFGGHVVGTSSPAQTVSLTNTGSVPLSITGFSVSGDFAQTNDCGSTLAPGATCTVSIVFTPTAGGNRAGTLTLNSNISGPAPVVSLSGVGLDYALSVSPSAVTIRTGNSAIINVTVQAVGGSFDSPVSLTCTGLPKGSKCKFVSETVTPGSTSTTVEMKLTSDRNSEPLGTSNVTITGTSGSLQRSTSLQVTLVR